MEGLQRVERLLALILIHDMKDAPQAEKAAYLSRVGFGNTEIAELLGTSAKVVTQQLYELRQARKRRGGGAKAGSKRGRKAGVSSKKRPAKKKARPKKG